MTTFIKNHAIQKEVNETLEEQKRILKGKIDGGYMHGPYGLNHELDQIDEQITNLQNKYKDLLLEKDKTIERIKMIDEYLKEQDDATD